MDSTRSRNFVVIPGGLSPQGQGPITRLGLQDKFIPLRVVCVLVLAKLLLLAGILYYLYR